MVYALFFGQSKKTLRPSKYQQNSPISICQVKLMKNWLTAVANRRKVKIDIL